MSKKVYLSPSMQEGNIGVGDYGTEEKRMNEVCDVVQEVLHAHGVATARNRTDMTLKEIVADSNRYGPDIHFAIHSNAAGRANAGKARGAEVYCYRFGGEGERLARAVYKRLSAITPSADRGVKESHSHFGPGKPLYETAYTKAPAALVEIAFHDNPQDAKWILNNIALIGTELARGVLDFFGIAYKQEEPPEPAPQEPAPQPEAIAVGAVVEIIPDAVRYYPGSVNIPSWVKSDYRHVVTADRYRGREVVKGGKRCVLLGRKIAVWNGQESSGIHTWVDAAQLKAFRPPQSQVVLHTVERGDTLWKIAEQYLGSGFRFPEIKAENALESNTIYPGQVLRIRK